MKSIKNTAKKGISVFGFFAITASMLMSADEYAAYAQSGLTAVFLLIVCALLWFIPVALCSAELATVEGMQEGGVYSWVDKTVGRKYGFMAIFFQWFQVAISFVTLIYFIIGALTYITDYPALNTNPILKLAVFLLIYWAATIFQLRGIKLTAKLVKWSFIIGVVIPALLNIVLAVSYIATGGKIQFSTSISAILPNFTSIKSLAFILPFTLAFAGIEASASHINEMKNPKKDYPIVLMIIVLLAITLDAAGGLSIATVVPVKDLSMNMGVIQGLEKMIFYFNSSFGWVIKIIAFFLAFGMFGEISAWIVGPIRGLYTTAQIGILPEYFNKLNKDGVPLRLILMQGIVVSIIAALVTLFGGSANAAFQLGIALTVMTYQVTYILIFTGYLNLTYKYQNLKRSFEIRGGKIFKTIIAITGLISSIGIFLLSFIPNSSVKTNNPLLYSAVLLCAFLISLAIPIIIYNRSDKSKHKQLNEIPVHHFKLSHINKWIRPRARGEFYWDETKPQIVKKESSYKK